MIVAFAERGWEDYRYWQEHDRKVVRRIHRLLDDIRRNPDDGGGLGKPEKLKGNLSGYYSRRITSEHRLVYTFRENMVIVAQCRFHY